MAQLENIEAIERRLWIAADNHLTRPAKTKFRQVGFEPFVRLPVDAHRSMAVAVAEAVAAELERDAADVTNHLPLGLEEPVPAMRGD